MMLRQRQEMPLVQTAPHILSPDHWDVQLLDAALPVTAQIIHTAGDYKRALEEITGGQRDTGALYNQSTEKNIVSITMLLCAF